MHLATLALTILFVSVTDIPAPKQATPGDVKVTYDGGDLNEDAWATLLKLDGRAEAMAEAFGYLVPLKQNLPVEFTACGFANAMYYPGASPKVVMCYEYMDAMLDTFVTVSPTFEDAIDRTIDATVHILGHELGHAVVEALDLPILVREEDVADAFATWMNTRIMRNADSPIAYAIYKRLKGLEDGDDSPEDVHSPDLVRYYNVLCWTLGSAPGDLHWLVPTLGARAMSCIDEYDTLDDGWLRLLQLYE